MSERHLETQFIKYLNTFNIAPEILEDITQMNEVDETEDKITLLNKELKEIDKRRKKWQYAWVNKMICDEDFSVQMGEEKDKEDDLNKQLSSLQPSGDKMNTGDLTEILLDIKSNWNQLDALEKKMLLQMFTKKIVVDRGSNQLNPDCLEIKEVEFN